MKKVILFMLLALFGFMLVSCGEDKPQEEQPEVNYYKLFTETELNEDVVVEAWVQDFETFWGGQTIYLADENGAYFGYTLGISEEDSKKLKVGDKLHIEGQKVEYNGQIEVANTTKVEIISGAKSYVKEAIDVTNTLTDKLAAETLQGAKIKANAKLLASSNPERPYLFKWNDSGEVGSDLYINLEINGNTFTFNVRTYLRGTDSDAYKNVLALTPDNVGQMFEVEAFVYIYEGKCQARITSFNPTK